MSRRTPASQDSGTWPLRTLQRVYTLGFHVNQARGDVPEGLSPV